MCYKPKLLSEYHVEFVWRLVGIRLARYFLANSNFSSKIQLNKQRKGNAKYTFEITGKAVQAANCFVGISAITEAAHKIIELEKYKDPDGITANCGIISGGTKINTVPEKCILQTDFRFSNSSELSSLKDAAKRIASICACI